MCAFLRKSGTKLIRSALGWALGPGLCLGTILAAVAEQKTPPTPLPSAQAKTILERSCVQCHSLDTVSAHHDTKEGWNKIIADMVSKGAQISDADSDILVKFLTRAQGNTEKLDSTSTSKFEGDYASPDPSTSQPLHVKNSKTQEDGRANRETLPEGPGRSAVQQVCAQCHSIQIVTSHRDTRAGWVQVVGNMASQGAEMSDEDADLIIKYLAANFPKTEDKTPQSNAQ